MGSKQGILQEKGIFTQGRLYFIGKGEHRVMKKEKKPRNCPTCDFVIMGRVGERLFCPVCEEAFRIIREYNEEETKQ